MSEHTKTPWKVKQTGVDLQEIYSADGESIATCWDIDHGVDSEANARHIVHCVNNHERLVDALRAAMRFIDCHVADPDLSHEMIEAYSDLNIIDPHKLLAQLQAGKGGE